MGTATRLRVLGTAGAAAALGLTLVTAGPATAAGTAYTCSGGHFPSGTYSNVVVTGYCTVAAGAEITITGNLTVAPGAMFDAQSAPSTITVSRNVTAGAGSLVGLGCQPPSATGNSAHQCAEDPEGASTINVGGNVTATGAQAVLLNGVHVGGNVTFLGGGSEVPWSIKNNTIDGNLTLSGQRAEWLGVLFNQVGGNATLSNIALSDPHPGAPGVYIVRNTIGRNLTCNDLTPGVSGGFDPTKKNVVGRNATGQCAALV
jgi:acetyltransferase-like isoleucine patch superfamily enzyme